MSRPAVATQWAQLLVLCAAHFVVDMFGNMLPVLLPALRDRFSMSLAIGGLVVSSCVLTSNIVQLATGHTRANKTSPLLLYIGLVLGPAICFVALLPTTTAGIWAMVALAAVSGTGIALVHPEGLRAVHRLKDLPSSVCSGLFMAGGFLGFSFGGLASAEIVHRYDLPGLRWIALIPLLCLLVVLFSRIKLATDDDPEATPETGIPEINVRRVPFWPLTIVAIPSGIAISIFCMLLPTRLEELGFELTWGGRSALTYGLGAAAGSFALSFLANRIGELRLLAAAMFASTPIIAIYLLLIQHRPAIWLLFACGFITLGSFFLLVTLARHAIGLNLGQRMGVIIGGTWGVAVIVAMALTTIADRIGGTALIIDGSVAGYLISATAALWLIKKTPPPPRTP